MDPSPACRSFLILLSALSACSTLEEDHGAGPFEESPGAYLEISDGAVCSDSSLRKEAPFALAAAGPDWESGQSWTANLPTVWGGGGVAVEDLTGDGVLDIYLTQAGNDQLYVGVPDGTFVDESAARLPEVSAGSSGVTSVDVEGDGDLDLFISELNGPNRLYLNNGQGIFSDSTSSAGFTGMPYLHMSSSWGDLDADGDLDLFITAWTDEAADWYALEITGRMGDADPNELYENLGNGTFRHHDVLSAQARYGLSFASGWYDFAPDGHPDIYVINDFGPVGYPNVLIDNVDGELADRPGPNGLDVSVYGMGLGVGDLNADRYPDVLVSSWDELLLLISDGQGGWYDAAAAMGITVDYQQDDRSTAWGSELADMDNNGELDAVVAYGYLNLEQFAQPVAEAGMGNATQQPDALWLQAQGRFTQVAEAWGLADKGISRGFALADFNNDGYLDIVKRFMDAPSKIYVSQCGDQAWLRVRLKDRPPNRASVGARVEVEGKIGGQSRTWIRWVSAGSTNFLSSGPTELHFGLGGVETIDRLRVVWPDGNTSEFEDLLSRKVVTVVREG